MFRALFRLAPAACRPIARGRMPARLCARSVSAVADVKPGLELADKFWENISVEDQHNGKSVTLAGKPLKTPEGNTITIPRSKPALLPYLLAEEWRNLSSLALKNHHIPLTSLAARAIDLTPEDRERITTKLLPYVDTDALLVIAPKKDCEGTLRAEQLKLFQPVVDDACKVWDIPSLSALDTDKNLFGNYQTPEVKEKVRAWIDSLDPWQFASLERATAASKSLIVGMNVVLRRRPIDELADLCNLEVIHQTKLWGEVEDTHDVEKADIRRLLGAAYINAL